MRETYSISSDGSCVYGAATMPLDNIGGYQYHEDGQRRTDSWTGLWWGVDPATGTICLFTRNNGGPDHIQADHPDAPDWTQLDALLDLVPTALADDEALAAARRYLCLQAAQACDRMAARAVWPEPWEWWGDWWRSAGEAA